MHHGKTETEKQRYRERERQKGRNRKAEKHRETGTDRGRETTERTVLNLTYGCIVPSRWGKKSVVYSVVRG